MNCFLALLIAASFTLSNPICSLDVPDCSYQEHMLPNEMLYDIPLSDNLQIYTQAVCMQYGIAPEIIYGMMYQESRFNASAVGDGGKALGILQIQPKWHAERMARLGVTDLLDPEQCILVAVDYLVELRDIYGYTEIWDALKYYRYGGLPISGENYPEIVTEYAKELVEKGYK